VILTNICCMCKRSEEMVDHLLLLLHFEVAYALWSAFFGWFGLSWVMSRRVSDLSPVGGPQGGGGVLRSGRWCLVAFFGVYGGRETIGPLRTWRGPWKHIILLFSYIVPLDCCACLSGVD
jgi:hypothetical protein